MGDDTNFFDESNNNKLLTISAFQKVVPCLDLKLKQWFVIIDIKIGSWQMAGSFGQF